MLRTIANGTLDAFTPMLDTDGIPINASDGGIIYADGKYHWYGLRLRPLSFASGGKGGQVTDTGVVMYASDDLTSWTYEGVILSCSAENHLLRAPMRFERPKILYNRRTGKYVLWCHYVASPGDHGFTEGTAEAGIAVCDTVNGQYKFLCTCRPIDSKGLVRDCTLFQDDDGSAYFIYDRQVSTEFHPVLQPFHAAARAATRYVHHDVQPAEGLDSLLNRRIYGRGIRDVAHDADRFPSRSHNSADRLFHASFVYVAYRDRRALGGKHPGGRSANIASGAGNPRNFVRKPHHTSLL